MKGETLRPINQTICKFKNGDCFQACVASILEQSLGAIPAFMKDGEDNFLANLNNFGDDIGIRFIDLAIKDKSLLRDCYSIACGKSPRNPDKRHAVVYFGDKIVHDPHPFNDGIVGDPEFYTMFIIKDPATFLTYPAI